MAERKFKFVSPGVFINEIDMSALPSAGNDVGPVVIGRSLRGPAMRPVQVNSFSEFIEVFGGTVPGLQANADPWREGNLSSPMYATYAAQAWLRNNSPLTFVRVLGEAADNATTTGQAGWNMDSIGTYKNPSATLSQNAGAYGLFIHEVAAEARPAQLNIWPNFASRDAAAEGGGGTAVEQAIALSTGSEGGLLRLTDTDGNKWTFEHASADNTITGSGDTSLSASHIQISHSVSQEAFAVNLCEAINKARVVPQSYGLPASAPGFFAYNYNTGQPMGNLAPASTLGNSGSILITQAKPGDVGNTLVQSHWFVAGAGQLSQPVSGGYGLGGGNIWLAEENIDAGYKFVSGSGPKDSLSINNSPGTLAAVWYLKDGYSILLSGSQPTMSGAAPPASASIGGLYKNADGGMWNVLIGNNSNPEKMDKYEFCFSRNASKFVRNVFNTDPTLLNTTITDSTKNYDKGYFLGESFEGSVNRVSNATSAGSYYGFVAALNNSTYYHNDRTISARASRTGWFISQDLRSTNSGFSPDDSSHVTKLFKFESLDDGEWSQNNLKISIADLKAPRNNFERYDSFSVIIRKQDDTDAAPVVMERYTNCNLNPDSENFIARRIGDKFLRWNETERRYQEEGDYDNNSKFIRVLLSDVVRDGTVNAEALPFGVNGPIRYKSIVVHSGSTEFDQWSNRGLTGLVGLGPGGNSSAMADTTTVPTTHKHNAATGHPRSSFAMKNWLDGYGLLTQVSGNANAKNPGNRANFLSERHLSGTYHIYDFPTVPVRMNTKSGSLVRPTDAYFGANFSRLHELTPSSLYDESNKDVVRALADGTYDATTLEPTAGQTDYSWIFTLDDLSGSAEDTSRAIYVSGSRKAGTSYTATGSKGYREVLDMGYDKFTAVLYGGSDGFDIFERDPLRNSRLDDASRVERDNYAYNSVKKAIDTVADAEAVEMDLLVVPGVKDTGITDHMIRVCEDRGDALAIIDLDGDYVNAHDGVLSVQNRIGDVDQAATKLRDRSINTSYACAFYPWVQIRDTASSVGAGSFVWVPPSVVALGTFSSTQRNADLWFAPAGFNRGGLSEGVAGLPVVNVRQKLTSKQRDKLYERNINPIASFPSEGIVVFGQKTLQVTPSALDRINVRRLLLFVKKQISRIASSILFEPNVRDTWDRFTSRVVPFLDSIKAQYGLSDFRLVLDETTTTDDLVDRNIMYAKIFLKPTRSIEFIALDFFVTNTGAAFED